MSETAHILVLANSDRVGGRCIAGRRAYRQPNGDFKVTPQWIRLTHPGDRNQGSVPITDTICPPDRVVKPRDYIQVSLLDSCHNADHPEDWYYDCNQKWVWKAEASLEEVSALVDTPASLWHVAEQNAVPVGYIRNMKPAPASLYLIHPPTGWTFRYFRDRSHVGKEAKRRRLQFWSGGKFHDYAVTDPEFDKRFDLPYAISEWPKTPQILTVPKPEQCFFCLSLTPEFNGRHYKICATFFET